MRQYYKTAEEVLDVPFVFSNYPEIENGDTIVSAVVTCAPDGLDQPDGTAATVTTTTEEDDTATNVIGGGDVNVNYLLTCTATFSNGSVRDCQGYLRVVSVLPN